MAGTGLAGLKSLFNRPGRPLKISQKIVLLVFLLLFTVLLIVGILAERILVSRLEESLEQNALDLAHVVAGIPEVQDFVGTDGGHLVIQPLVEGLRVKTEAEFIVVMDMESTRYSHPVPERIGQKFVGGDEGRALQGETYTSVAMGTLGQSLRAFVPIYRDGQQVGVVSVGILMDDIMQMIGQLRLQVALAALAGLGLGLVGSGYLAWNIKKSMFGMEPHKISALLNERVAILESVREGIVAVDRNGYVIYSNHEARRLLGIESDVVGMEAENLLPVVSLREVLDKGKPVNDVEMNLSRASVLSNFVPIKSRDGGKTVGVIVSFRDMTEVRKIAEELTGVMRFVETLRIQNHEFNNKLHTISGLIQLGEYDRAVEYISSAAATRRQLISFVSERIKDPAVAAVLLGKYGRARELDIGFSIHGESILGEIPGLEGTTLAAVIGNLVDNALEAVQQANDGEQKVEVAIFDSEEELVIRVEDTGTGISEKLQDKIFEKGFTTGKEDHQGLGLYIVSSFVESLCGEIKLESKEGKGTVVTVYIPYEKDST